MKKLAIAVSLVTILLGSIESVGQTKNTKLIGMKDVKLTSKLMQPETLWMFGRLGSIAVSPDGKQVAYTVTWYDIEENTSNSEIYIMNTDGSNKKQLTKTPERENSLTWRPDAKVLNYMSEGQLWEMNPDGTGAKQLTKI
jgi:Tol biopolymer transport system component